MPTVQITDNFGVSLNAELAPAASLAKYAQGLPGLLMQGADLARLGAFTLRDPAVRSLEPGLAFQRPVSLGTGAPALALQADAAVSFRIVEGGGALFSPDEYGDNIAVPEGRCCVALGLRAKAGAGTQVERGSLSFGVDAGGEVAVSFYRPFSAGADAPNFLEALEQSIGGLVIPATPEDLNALPAGCVATVCGKGNLQLSASANVLAVANPLATVALPSPAPALSVTQGAKVEIGASWEVSGEYQVRAHKVDARRVRLGWYRKHGSEASVTASADVGVSAEIKGTDLFERLIRAISSDAQADLDELRSAGMGDEQAGSIAEAVEAAVNRKLELGIAAELGSLRSDEAAFLYEVDLPALGEAGTEAVRRALKGDLGALAGAKEPPAGISEERNILKRANNSCFSLKINLLGIFNFGSVSRLALDGCVKYTPSTGEVVIADKATATRIESTAVNFGADEEKLRGVMAESFLITAAYRGSRSVMTPPKLASAHQFFKLDSHTSREELLRYAAIAPALRLAPTQLPPEIGDFGRTSVFAEARYDDALARELFLRADGTPRRHEDYEAAGRRAIALLVPADQQDAYRRAPATDDKLWKRMKELGQPNFSQLFPDGLRAAVVAADYTAIQWWANSMCGTGDVLARMDRLQAGPRDQAFQELRQELANHMRDVAGKTHAYFGEPWGLVAMFLVTGRSETALHITGPRFVYTGERALRLAA